jgi:hypothetical protein
MAMAATDGLAKPFLKKGFGVFNIPQKVAASSWGRVNLVIDLTSLS